MTCITTSSYQKYAFSGEEAARCSITMSFILITHSTDGMNRISGVFVKCVCLHSRQLDTNQDEVEASSRWRWANSH